MKRLAIIGGTGMIDWARFDERITIETPYGDTSAPVERFGTNHLEIFFLPRHGRPHRLPPHCVNYRANVWALAQCRPDALLSIHAVGGITEQMGPGVLALPDQIIDYTWGREHTYWDGEGDLLHIEFADPYAGPLRSLLLSTAQSIGQPIVDGGCHGVRQGPRLETAAEIVKMRREGCDLVGMTGMPEAALARELDLDFCSLTVVANWAAGVSDDPIDLEAIDRTMAGAASAVEGLIAALQ